MQAEKSFRTFYFKKEKQVKGEPPELSLENWVSKIKQQIKGSDSEYKQKLVFDYGVKYWKVCKFIKYISLLNRFRSCEYLIKCLRRRPIRWTFYYLEVFIQMPNFNVFSPKANMVHYILFLSK